MRRATERQDEAVRAWLASTYPAIARKARAQGGEIQWADKTGLSNTTVEFRGIRAILLGSVLDCSETASEGSECF
jgi:hypothetical protein